MNRKSALIRVTSVLLTLALMLTFFLATGPAVHADAAVFINEIHYDNFGIDADEAIEIAGPAGTDLSGWSVVLYNGSGGSSYGAIDLNGTLPDQDNGYGALSFAHAGIQNGSPDGLALVSPGDIVEQFLCYGGTFAAANGPAAGMTCQDIGVAEPGNPGESLQLTGTGLVYENFVWTGPTASSFGSVNAGQTFDVAGNAPVSADCGYSFLRTYETAGAVRDVSATDADGTVVAMSIDVDPAPAAGSITLENFVAAGDAGQTATAQVVVSPDVPAVGAGDGDYYVVTLTAANDDGPSQEGTCTFNVDVDPFLTIGEVQGVVADTDSGTAHRSPYEDDYVAIQGVIYAKTQQYNSYGGAYYGFFIQNTADTADGDPQTSDGIFVYHSYRSTLRTNEGGVSYTPEVGDEVILRGSISEYYNLTEMVNPYMMELVRDNVDVDAELPPFETNPSDDLEDAYRYWERREGMRAQVPSGSIVLNGRDVFASSFDAEVWVARPDSSIAQRSDPYERRSFRDAHPLDDIPGANFDNGNGYRILLGSLGIKATADDTTAMIAPSRTYDTLVNAPVGGVYYAFGKYSIQVDTQIDLAHGVDPAANDAPALLEPGREYSVVTFNVENLYDYVDDAFDGCDFLGNAGCPGVYPPFDYAPASNEIYQTRLHEIATQIVDDLHSPDLLLVQEVEDQDVCYIDSGQYTCPDFADQVNNADGKPDALQELATVIQAMGGPSYGAALDRDGADDRGIVSGYLYRLDRVQLMPATPEHPVLGSDPQVDYPYSDPLPYNSDVQNPKVFNAVLPDFVTGSTDGDNVFTRAPQVAWFRIWRDGIGATVFQDVYTINNHFSSGPDDRVGQRTEQANYNAAIVAALQSVNPDVYVSVGGDLNVYPRPDDPFPPPNSSDQLAGLYNQGMTNLYDIHVLENPVAAYSYIYQGQSQTLDQMFVVPTWLTDLEQVAVAHINADWPSDYAGDGARGTSDHDPTLAAYSLLPTTDRLETLVQYFDQRGDLAPNQTAKILLDRLDRAHRFYEAGQMESYYNMIRTFILQVQGFAPRQISQEAADILQHEAMMLLPAD